MVSVTYVAFDGSKTTVDVPEGENVMRGALYNNIDGIVGECGGGLSCATCHCYVDDAWADKVGGPSSKDEADLLEGVSAEKRPTSRLSCQIFVTADMDGLVINLPETQY